MRDLTILGAGISGLTTALFLAKSLPASTRIRILEGSERAGGWMHSVERNGFILERGTRSLTPHFRNRQALGHLVCIA
jgi:oxygen-dependent protoporphyrinogen oxidase